jgi:hypothetical protein
MASVRTWGWAVLAAALVLAHSPPASAQHVASKPNALSTAPTRGEAPPSAAHEKPQRTGDPVLGVIIVVGLVGVVIFMAWVISRVGEGRKPPSDHTLE